MGFAQDSCFFGVDVLWITFLICYLASVFAKALLSFSLAVNPDPTKSMGAFDKKTVWQETLESIKVSVSDAIFRTWFKQTHLVSLKKQGKRFVVEVGCPSSFIKATVESRYFGLIQDSLSQTLGSPCDLIFVVKQIPGPRISKQSQPSPLFDRKEKDKEKIAETIAVSRIRPGFTFKNFAVSSSNQMAWAAAEAVTKNPGSAYNPLFLWGGVGVGKTHLMNAIGHKIIERDVDAKILSCTGEDFTNDIVQGIRNKTTLSFRNKYRKLKVLLLDDIQFIAGKVAVQEEFFHTFNALVSAVSQVVLASDGPPEEIAKLENRLKSRFEAGLIVDITEPDFELRCAIIQIKAKERGIELPMDLVQLIAGNVDSARRIEGFLVRLFSVAKVRGTEINEEIIESQLGSKERTDGQLIKASPTQVISAVSKYYTVGKRALLGSSRTRPIARPRQVLMYLLRTQLGLPLQEVGRIIGGRDHTTVIHAVDKITHLAKDDVNTRQDIRGIKNLL